MVRYQVSVLYTRRGALRVTLMKDGQQMPGMQYQIYAPLLTSCQSGQIIDNLIPDIYKIILPDVSGYLTPLDTDVVVSSDKTTEVVFHYEKIPAIGPNEYFEPGSLQIRINPPEVRTLGAQWRIEGIGWQSSDAKLTNMRPGRVTILAKPVPGWYAPSPETVIVRPGQLTAKSIDYIKMPAHELGMIPEIEAIHGQLTALKVEIPETMPAGSYLLPHTLSAVPDGPLSFDAATGLFEYTAAETDNTPFTVTFCASPPAGAGENVCQTVRVRPVAGPVKEEDTVSYDDPDAPVPDAESTDYITITEEVHGTCTWNAMPATLVKNIKVTGQTIRIQQGASNGIYEILHNNKNIHRIQLYAEKVIVRGKLYIPGASLSIVARIFEFEDNSDSDIGSIDLTPVNNTVLPEISKSGWNGQDCGNIYMNVEEMYFDYKPGKKRFILVGANGQPGGPGESGIDGSSVLAELGNSFNWQERTKKAGVPQDIRGKMIDRILYIHDLSAEVKSKGAMIWPVDAIQLKKRGKPGAPGKHGILTAPRIPGLQAVTDARYGQPGTLYPVEPMPPHPMLPSPNPAFWLWVGPETEGPSASTRASDSVQDLELHHYRDKKAGATVFFYMREYDRSRIHDSVPEMPDDPGSPYDYVRDLSPAEKSGWICHEAMLPALLYLKDLYIEGHIRRTRDLAFEYKEILTRALMDPDLSDPLNLQAILDEISVIYDQANAGLDYFGNPPGWTPMLSFEANATIYRNEYKSAFPMLFLARWIEADARRLEKSISALNAAIAEKEKEINTYKDDLNTNRAKLPALQNKVQDLSRQKTNLEQEKMMLENYLLNLAKKEAKTPWYMTAFKVVGGILKVLPFPEAQLLSSGLDLATNFSWDSGLRLADRTTSFALRGHLTDFSTELNAVMGEITGIVPSSIKNRQEAAAAYLNAKIRINALQAEANKYIEAASIQGASQDKIAEIFEKIKKDSFAFQTLLQKIEKGMAEEAGANNAVITVETAISTANAALLASYIELGELRTAVTSTLRSQDHKARQYFKIMEQRIRHHLLQQHYYMAKAYEFRVLENYPFQLQLSQQILDSLMSKIAEHTIPGDPNSPLHGPTLSPEEIQALETPFEDQMRSIVQNFVQKSNENSPDQAQNYYLTLSPEQLDELNRRKQITINLQHLGRLMTHQDNHRVADIFTDQFSVAYSGTDPDPQLNITYTHSGISRMRYKGKTYIFQHYKDADRSPMQWTTSYYQKTGTWNEAVISPQSQSMLSFITGGLDKDQFYYCAPSAWADITIRLEGHRKDFTVNQLRIGFEIFYTPKPTDKCDIYVAPLNELMPPVRVSRGSNAGLQDGAGEMFRQYQSNSGSVTFTTVSEHGDYVFSHWLLDGNPVLNKSNTSSILVSTDAGHIITPVFVPAPAIVPDLTDLDYAPRPEPSAGTDPDEYASSFENYSDAEMRLLMRALKLGNVRYERTGDNADKGKVLRQHPLADTALTTGSPVHIVVSSGTDDAPDISLDEIMEELLGHFDTLDTDGSGGLSWNEIRDAYPDLWQEDFDTLDADGDGELSPEELGYTPPLCDISSREAVFRLLLLLCHEGEGAGVLTREDFQTVRNAPPAAMNDWKLLDLNQDGVATIEEFISSA